MAIERKVGDIFEMDMCNGYKAVFEVVSVNPDKTCVANRKALIRATEEVKTAPIVETKEEVKPEIKKPVKAVKKSGTVKRK